MPQLLLELLSEEIPARMQAQAAKDLERLVTAALIDRGFLFEGARAFATPRRLALAVEGLPARQPDVSEERKGPRTSAPQAALDGFLKSTGLSLDQLRVQTDPKGDFYLAVIKRAGRDTADVLAEVLPEAIRALPWPKSMRPGVKGPRWVRPLVSILCTFDGELVPFALDGISSGTVTQGHRWMSDGPIEVRRFDDYVAKLKSARVILDPAERADIIRADATSKAFALGLELVEDEGLLAEVAGLVEWPVVLVGAFDPAFLDVPAEVLTSTMRTNQKYFALRDPKTRRLAPKFVVVANLEAKDGGREIVAGNERVLRARLSDAKFFWEQDKKIALAQRLPSLSTIVFHAKLGTQRQRVDRIVALAGEIAAAIGADVAAAKRAAELCKADLVSGTVGEFPEVQGIIGGYLARHEGLGDAIADAIRDHYKPLGPSDAVPTAPASIAVALADKIDTLLGFFSIGEKSTGSKDPFALRRAALGVIRIILTSGVRLSLKSMMGRWPIAVESTLKQGQIIEGDLIAFLADRLKTALRDQGVRHDLIDAVFAIGSGRIAQLAAARKLPVVHETAGCEDDFVRLVARVQALQAFLRTEDGVTLLAGYRRAVNILKIEEKKDKARYDGPPDVALLQAPEEIALFKAMAIANDVIASELRNERFADAMRAMARLRAPVDAFFEKVTVNAPEAALRTNRLLLLSQIRAALHAVADFGKIEG